MSDIAAKIKEYTETLERKQKIRDKKQGRLDAEMDRLKSLGFESIEDAKRFIETETAKIGELKEQLERDLEETLTEARRLRATLTPGLTVVRVALEDRPGEIAAVGRALSETGIDVRDLQLRHAPYGGGGILTLSVRSGDEIVISEALEASGLTTTVASAESD
jgi:hypothetical protein